MVTAHSCCCKGSPPLIAFLLDLNGSIGALGEMPLSKVRAIVAASEMIGFFCGHQLS